MSPAVTGTAAGGDSPLPCETGSTVHREQRNAMECVTNISQWVFYRNSTSICKIPQLCALGFVIHIKGQYTLSPPPTLGEVWSP